MADHSTSSSCFHLPSFVCTLLPSKNALRSLVEAFSTSSSRFHYFSVNLDFILSSSRHNHQSINNGYQIINSRAHTDHPRLGKKNRSKDKAEAANGGLSLLREALPTELRAEVARVHNRAAARGQGPRKLREVAELRVRVHMHQDVEKVDLGISAHCNDFAKKPRRKPKKSQEESRYVL